MYGRKLIQEMLWPIYENVALLGEGGSFRKCGGYLGDVVSTSEWS